MRIFVYLVISYSFPKGQTNAKRKSTLPLSHQQPLAYRFACEWDTRRIKNINNSNAQPKHTILVFYEWDIPFIVAIYICVWTASYSTYSTVFHTQCVCIALWWCYLVRPRTWHRLNTTQRDNHVVFSAEHIIPYLRIVKPFKSCLFCHRLAQFFVIFRSVCIWSALIIQCFSRCWHVLHFEWVPYVNMFWIEFFVVSKHSKSSLVHNVNLTE